MFPTRMASASRMPSTSPVNAAHMPSSHCRAFAPLAGPLGLGMPPGRVPETLCRVFGVNVIFHCRPSPRPGPADDSLSAVRDVTCYTITVCLPPFRCFRTASTMRSERASELVIPGIMGLHLLKGIAVRHAPACTDQGSGHGDCLQIVRMRPFFCLAAFVSDRHRFSRGVTF